MKNVEKTIRILKNYYNYIDRANELDNKEDKTILEQKELEKLDRDISILNEVLDDIMYDRYYPIIEYEIMQGVDQVDVLLDLDCKGWEYEDNRSRLINIVINKLMGRLI